MWKILAASADHPLFREAAVSGLAGTEIAFLREAPDEVSAREMAVFRSELATALCREGDPVRVKALLVFAAEPALDPGSRLPLLQGIVRGLSPERPLVLDRRPEQLDVLLRNGREAVRKAGVAVAARITWPGDARRGAGAGPVRALTETERERFRRGRDLYRETCMACHQVHGKGMASLAPPLAGSSWVTGSEERLVRIALQGVHGPLVVGETEWNLAMPGLVVNPHMTDENLAAILTYVRRAWGNGADPVAPERVGSVREKTKERKLPWTAEELQRLP